MKEQPLIRDSAEMQVVHPAGERFWPQSSDLMHADALQNTAMSIDVSLRMLLDEKYSYINDKKGLRLRAAVAETLSRIDVQGSTSNYIRKILGIINDSVVTLHPFLELCKREIPTHKEHLSDRVDPLETRLSSELFDYAASEGALQVIHEQHESVQKLVDGLSTKLFEEFSRIAPSERTTATQIRSILLAVSNALLVVFSESVRYVMNGSDKSIGATGFVLAKNDVVRTSTLINLAERIRSSMPTEMCVTLDRQILDFSKMHIRRLESLPSDAVGRFVRGQLDGFKSHQGQIAQIEKTILLREWWKNLLGGPGEVRRISCPVQFAKEKRALMPPGSVTLVARKKKGEVLCYHADKEMDTTIVLRLASQGFFSVLQPEHKEHVVQLSHCMPLLVSMQGNLTVGGLDEYVPVSSDEAGRVTTERVRQIDIDVLEWLRDYFDQWPGLYSQMSFLGPWVLLQKEVGTDMLLCPAEHEETMRSMLGTQTGVFADEIAQVGMRLKGKWVGFLLPEKEYSVQPPMAAEESEREWRSRIRQAHASVDSITLEDIERYLKPFGVQWDRGEGKGSHWKVTNPQTGMFSTISQSIRTTESIGMGTLWNILRQLGIGPMDFYRRNWRDRNTDGSSD